jgi:hypothetical protein
VVFTFLFSRWSSLLLVCKCKSWILLWNTWVSRSIQGMRWMVTIIFGIVIIMGYEINLPSPLSNPLKLCETVNAHYKVMWWWNHHLKSDCVHSTIVIKTNHRRHRVCTIILAPFDSHCVLYILIHFVILTFSGHIPENTDELLQKMFFFAVEKITIDTCILCYTF